jgi:hypothetical protein
VSNQLDIRKELRNLILNAYFIINYMLYDLGEYFAVPPEPPIAYIAWLTGTGTMLVLGLGLLCFCLCK